MPSYTPNLKLYKWGVDDEIQDTISEISSNEELIDEEFSGYAINVKWLGVKGDGITDDTANLIKAFAIANTNGSVKLYFPAGKYLITGVIRVYDNTSVLYHPDAVLKRNGTNAKLFMNGEYLNKTSVGGYDGAGNIHFYGGTFDLNGGSGLSTSSGSGVFDLGHAENVTFSGMIIKNGQNGHILQISGCKDVTVDKCQFLGQTNTDGSTLHEPVQIEATGPGAFPSFGLDDNTPSKNVVVKNCIFENTIRGVGTHSWINTQTTTGSVAAGSTQLTVADASKFNAGESIWIQGADSDGSNLSTTISSVNTTTKVITLASAAGKTVSNTKIANQADMDNVSVYCENITIKDNRFLNIADHAITIYGFKNAKVLNNDIISANYYGIALSHTKDGVYSNNRVNGSRASGVYMDHAYGNKFSNNKYLETCTWNTEANSGKSYCAIRATYSDDNMFDGETVYSDNPAYTVAFYTDNSYRNKVTRPNFKAGTNTSNGGKIGGYSTNTMDNTYGPENVVLYDGDISAAATTVSLSEDIRGFSFLIIVGNNGANPLVSITIPKVILTYGSTTNTYRVPISTTSQADFSFPSYASIRLDTITGSGRIKKVIGVR